SPLFFTLLAVIPVVIFYRKRNKIYPAMRISALGSTGELQESFFVKTRWVVPFLKYLALGLLVTAMARPQWGTRQVSTLTEGINIILAVDVSESMAALDFKRQGKIVDRLEAVKGVIREFIAKRNGDRIGMVVFGSNAYTQIPLTRDYNTIALMLDRIKIGVAGKSTAVGDAIGISLKRLEDIKSKSNIIILLTDGRSNSGELSPEVATEIAAEKNIKIYTVGVGTRGKVPFLINHPVFGERYIYRQVDFDEKTLGYIADKTGALYFKAEDIKGLQRIYDTIDTLEKTKVKVKTFAEYKEFYSYFLVCGFAVLVLWIILSNTRYLRVP
ncbi:MAG: VWA domain-containing protein, partial [Deltaproteobacteria bacterium]|nr:VWA domain-containing protein [Deltaproteobacteria bacterium]